MDTRKTYEIKEVSAEKNLVMVTVGCVCYIIRVRDSFDWDLCGQECKVKGFECSKGVVFINLKEEELFRGTLLGYEWDFARADFLNIVEVNDRGQMKIMCPLSNLYTYTDIPEGFTFSCGDRLKFLGVDYGHLIFNVLYRGQQISLPSTVRKSSIAF